MNDKSTIQIDDNDLHALFQESLEEALPEMDEPHPLLGSLIKPGERYSDRDLIATGGMKCIYRVFDKKTGRHVALAELKHDMAPRVYEAFLMEARLTGILEHPNIITIHDIGIYEDKKPYFTMELKIGDSLGEILKKIRNEPQKYTDEFPLIDLLNIFIRICDAISYAHSRSVIHLDLKPDNIQIGSFGEVLVCDWGLGKILGEADLDDYETQKLNPDLLNDITLTGQIKGTPGYMAPEQIHKKVDKSEKCDIYALGAILYSLLTKEAPLSGDTEEILQKTLGGEINPPDTISKNIPRSLSAVVMKALATEPDSRYSNVNEMRNDVHQYLLGHSTPAENAGLLTEATLFFKRHLAICLISFAFIFLGCLGTALFIKGLNQSIENETRAREIAERQEAKALIAQEQAEHAMKLYEDQQQRSQQALQLYQEEKNWNDNFVRNSAKEVMYRVYRLTDVDIYTTPVDSLNKALRSLNSLIKDREDSAPKLLLQQRAYIYFIQGKFDQVLASPYNHGSLYALANAFLHSPPKDELISPETYENLIQESRKYEYGHINTLFGKMLVYDARVRNKVQDHSQLVYSYLKNQNKQWKRSIYEFSKEKRHLRLKGKKLHSLGYYLIDSRSQQTINYCYLSGLKLNSLDLSDTEVYDLNQISSLKITSLDIRNTLITDLRPLQKMTDLKKLIISKDQFPQEQLRLVPSNIQLIYKI